MSSVIGPLLLGVSFWRNGWFRRRNLGMKWDRLLEGGECGVRLRKYCNTKFITVLGIETSCDDTAVAIVRSNKTILGHSITSQDHIHKYLKGIIPSVAANHHRLNIQSTISTVFQQVKLKNSADSFGFEDLTAIAVTRGPGMGVCLDVGLETAKELALRYQKPLIAVNHMEGHALVARLAATDDAPIEFPFLTLLISGGHTLLLICKGVGSYIQLGTTLDDSIGEAYDKVARLLGLEWQGGGGKALEQQALLGKKNNQFHIRTPMKSVKNCNFSFSGIKTAIKNIITNNHLTHLQKDVIPSPPDQTTSQLPPQVIPDIAYSFQTAVVSHLLDRVNRALEYSKQCYPNLKHFVVSGGVASNEKIRTELISLSTSYAVQVFFPPKELCTDNGVMIAWAGYENYRLDKCTFSPTECQSLRYEPKWKLDPLGDTMDYFPGAHQRDPIKRRINRGPRLIAKCEVAISQHKFDRQLFLEGIKSALELKDYTQAATLCNYALKSYEKKKKGTELFEEEEEEEEEKQLGEENVIEEGRGKEEDERDRKTFSKLLRKIDAQLETSRIK